MLSPAPPSPSLCHLSHPARAKGLVAPWGHSQASRWTHSLWGFLVFFFLADAKSRPKNSWEQLPVPRLWLGRTRGGGGGKAALASSFPKFQGMWSARAGREGRRVILSSGLLSLQRDGAQLGAAAVQRIPGWVLGFFLPAESALVPFCSLLLLLRALPLQV